MDNNKLDKFLIFYWSPAKGHDWIQFFSNVDGYEYLIECIKKYIELSKNDKNSRFSLSYKNKYHKLSTLNFLFKTKGEIDTISLTYNINQENIEEINVYATIEIYEYLTECLYCLVESLLENELGELSLDSGIDVDCDSPSLGFYYLRD